ncbi:MAG: permease prefix domain 1-containing protein, partial [Terriglobia bacterium]
MSLLQRLFSRRKRMMQDLDQDIRDFIERETQDNIGRGMPPEEARYAALRKFGNVTRIKEDTWEVWSFVWLEQIWQDIRLGLRMLAKNPGFTAVAALTLALGIGANTAMFSVVDAVLLEPLPYAHPEQIVQVMEKHPDGQRHLTSTLDFLDWKNQNTVFESMAAEWWDSMALTGGDVPVELGSLIVSASYFRIFRAKPLLGRTFAPDEDQPGK